MTSDITRHTFRRDKHFTAVRKQQGRVDMDADWNEAIDIALHRDRTALTHVVGPTGMPEDDPGFALTPIPGATQHDLAIGHGTAYVDGILVEHLAADATTLKRKSGGGANTVFEVTSGPRLAVGMWVGPESDPLSAPVQVTEAVNEQGGTPLKLQRVKLSAGIGGGTKVMKIIPAYGSQPHMPTPPKDLPAGPYLAWLDVWERPITALEDPSIKDVALGGPDTATRTRIEWKVELLPLKPLIDAGDLTAPPVCKSFGPNWHPDGGAAPAKLAARTKPQASDPNPCALPSSDGYRSLKNHLFRVQVHAPVSGSTKLFLKWSNDNAIHRTKLLDVKDASLVVSDVGKDKATALGPGQFVEVRDEPRILRGEPGFFVELGDVVDNRIGIERVFDPFTLAELKSGGKPDTDKLPKTGIVRRWEGGLPVATTPNTAFALEKTGIEVRFAAGLAHSGDHWLIPARTLNASIEWPKDEATGDASFEPPVGIVHHACPLAILEHAANDKWTVKDDCRPIFPPLTRLTSFFYLGGDGQEAMPNLVGTGVGTRVALDAPLRVGVARGRTPVEGRAVRFRVTNANNKGVLSAVPGASVIASSAHELIVRTGADGVAQARFALDRRRHAHHVVAELLDATDPPQASPQHLAIHFQANTSIAAEVAYDPDECAYQQMAEIKPGVATNVQDAIDKLCPRIELTMAGGDGQELCVGKPAPGALRVGVYWGKAPLHGTKVTFKVTSGDATVNPPTAVVSPTGIASTTLIAGDNPQQDGGVVKVIATPDTPEKPLPHHVFFTARFVQAECVYGGTGGQPGFHATGVFLDGTSTPLKRDVVLTPEVLAKGLRFEFDMELAPDAIKKGNPGPIPGEVVLDLAFPDNAMSNMTWWLDDFPPGPERIFGTRPTRLAGHFTLQEDRAGRNGHALVWRPTKTTDGWLRSRLLPALQKLKVPRLVPARAVLHGNRIWSKKDRRVFLDGDLFADPGTPSGFAYPSGDGIRGGDLVAPFHVGVTIVVADVFPLIAIHMVKPSVFFQGMSTNHQKRVAQALDAAVDRKEVEASDVLPTGVTIDTSRPQNATRAKQLLGPVNLTRTLRVLAHDGHAKLFAAMRNTITEVTDLKMLRVRATSPGSALKRLQLANPQVDAVLLDQDILTAIQNDDRAKKALGTRLLRL